MFSKYLKYIALLTMACSFFPRAVKGADVRDSGDRSAHELALNDRDLQALHQFLEQKRVKDLLEKATNMTISGDVRLEWRHMTETMCGKSLRSKQFEDRNDVRFSHNDFDIEANLWVKYEKDRSWGTMQLQFDNSAGIDDNDCCHFEDLIACSDDDGGVICGRFAHLVQCAGTDANRRFHGNGICGNLCLKRAYMGYLIYKSDCFDFIAELGRRPLYDVFESDIEFSSRFDGIMFEARAKKVGWADRVYGKIIGLIVDERTNHFAWGMELGILNASGWDLKYSYMDWVKNGKDRCERHNPNGFEYRNSQILATYHFDNSLLCRPFQVYGAVLYNHAGSKADVRVPIIDFDAKGDPIIVGETKVSGSPWGFYAGFIVGEVEKENDWSIEVEYEWVGQNAIAFDDENGIGVGDLLADFCNGPGPSTGYHGFYIDYLYALTDQLSIDTTINVSRALDKFPNLQGEKRHRRHHFSKLEVEAVYGF